MKRLIELNQSQIECIRELIIHYFEDNCVILTQIDVFNLGILYCDFIQFVDLLKRSKNIKLNKLDKDKLSSYKEIIKQHPYLIDYLFSSIEEQNKIHFNLSIN